MTIDEEIKALLLMISLPPPWETFATILWNASATTIKYYEVTNSILSKDAQRKTFVQDSASDAFMVQSTSD